MRRKKSPIKLIMLAILALAVLLGASYYAGHLKAQAITLQALTNMGLDASFSPAPEAIPGQLLYSNVNLDNDGVSTIDKLHVRFSPGILLSGKLDNLTLHNLSLVGELGKDYTAPSISGWNNQYVQDAIMARNVNIKNGRILLMSEDFGGMSFDLNMQITNQNDEAEIIGKIDTMQRDIGFSGALNSTINTLGSWQGELQIERGKIALDHVLLSRTSGNINWAPTRLLCNLQIGGMRILDTPWDNASLSIEDTQEHLKIFVEAKALGNIPIELSLTYDLPRENESHSKLSGLIYAPDMKSLLSYFEQYALLPEEQMKQLKGLDTDATDVQIAFTLQYKDQPKISYQVQSQDGKVNTLGLFRPDDSPSFEKLPWRLLKL